MHWYNSLMTSRVDSSVNKRKTV